MALDKLTAVRPVSLFDVGVQIEFVLVRSGAMKTYKSLGLTFVHSKVCLPMHHQS
jgi:hypothetical protein